MIATDRISAFDVVLPRPIPFKGQVLNQCAAYFLNATSGIVPNHVISIPDPNVTIGKKAKPIPIEVVVRAYLAGHSWRLYDQGLREICGVKLPEGLKENDRLPEPIITPTTKSQIGHDEDITEREILKSKLIDEDDWARIAYYSHLLFKRGTELAHAQGLILVDTKYEFGWYQDEVILIDEIHTPDSSRYFYLEGYESAQTNGQPQRQLSKEFVRKWLIENGFQGKEGQAIPHMPDAFVAEIQDRYIELYEKVTGKTFQKAETSAIEERIQNNVFSALKALGMQQ